MNRRTRGQPIDGIVILDKPAGITSNRALQKVRGLFNARKAGHTGNLDPFATGMLPICLGAASKTAAFMLDANKTYIAKARLGIATETGDPEGAIISETPVLQISADLLESVFDRFRGEIEQVPPMYSALKHQGQPLYKLARDGKTVERKSRKVHIHDLLFRSLAKGLLEFEVRCSKGTYIRTLAEDIATDLGTCAHLVELRRLSVEPFLMESMVSLEQLVIDCESGQLEKHLLAADAGLASWPLVRLNMPQAIGFSQGMPQLLESGSNGWVRVYGPGGELLGLGVHETQGMLKPRRVFVNEQNEQNA